MSRAAAIVAHLVVGVIVFTAAATLTWLFTAAGPVDRSKVVTVFESADGVLYSDPDGLRRPLVGSVRAHTWTLDGFPNTCSVAQDNMDVLTDAANTLSDLSPMQRLQWEHTTLAAQHLCSYETYAAHLERIGSWVNVGRTNTDAERYGWD